VKSLHHMLERPELADLVIPDLARWEDWGAIDELMTLYKTADEKSSWVRVPVVNYLRACPLPRAKDLLKECEKIDPAAYKRATTWFPSTPSATPAPTPEKASQGESQGKVAPIASIPVEDERTPDEIAGGKASPVVPAGAVVAVANSAMPVPPDDEELAAVNQGAAPAAALKQSVTAPANLWLVLGVPWAVGLTLLAVQFSLLRVRF
jgi:hypothetical protein